MTLTVQTQSLITIVILFVRSLLAGWWRFTLAKRCIKYSFSEQKKAIQKVTLSRIICENTGGVDEIQLDAFRVESR